MLMIRRIIFNLSPLGHQMPWLADCLGQLSKCVDEIMKWMSVNLLKVNIDKMEFIMFGAPYHMFLVTVKLRSELVLVMMT